MVAVRRHPIRREKNPPIPRGLSRLSGDKSAAEGEDCSTDGEEEEEEFSMEEGFSVDGGPAKSCMERVESFAAEWEGEEVPPAEE